jgi:hypothetical protein
MLLNTLASTATRMQVKKRGLLRLLPWVGAMFGEKRSFAQTGSGQALKIDAFSYVGGTRHRRKRASKL